jgi:hypothetical protein
MQARHTAPWCSNMEFVLPSTAKIAECSMADFVYAPGGDACVLDLAHVVRSTSRSVNVHRRGASRNRPSVCGEFLARSSPPRHHLASVHVCTQTTRPLYGGHLPGAAGRAPPSQLQLPSIDCTPPPVFRIPSCSGPAHTGLPVAAQPGQISVEIAVERSLPGRSADGGRSICTRPADITPQTRGPASLRDVPNWAMGPLLILSCPTNMFSATS